MKFKMITIFLLTIIIATLIITTCEELPEAPQHTNIYDASYIGGDDIPPIISLTINPDSGITGETKFMFDASRSYENDKPGIKLYYRWDIDNNSNYESDWSENPIFSDTFQVGGGNKDIKLEVKGLKGLISDTIFTVFVNTRPQPQFTATVNAGNYLLHNFDASSSYDYEDGSNLHYRWDFDGDGNWDTEWLMQDTISYEYVNPKAYTSELSVRDLDNLTSEIYIQLIVGCVDIDGNVYNIVKIGNQWWMAENLKVIHYRNGDAIPHVTDHFIWDELITGAYCNHTNDINNVTTYGRLYNWYAVNDSRNIAPAGWHVPSNEEWKELEMFLGMTQLSADSLGYRGTDEGGKMKEAGYVHWIFPNTGATNSSGFTALPGGYRDDWDGWSVIGGSGLWWASTEYNFLTSFYLYLAYDDSRIFRFHRQKYEGLSIRCVRD
jgi:uncharacterized protein (TIGR02145 family)